MQKNKKKLLLTLLLVLFLYFAYCLFFSKNTEIKIISFNDFHGSIEDKNNVGAEKFFNFIKENTDNNTIVVSAGDNFQGELISNYFFGLPVIDFFKEINLYFSAIGNHEFDWGIEKVNNEWKDIKFLSANVLKNKKLLTKPYLIKEIDGVKIGFIGLTTQESYYKVDKKRLNNIEILDPVETAKKYVKILKKQGVNSIILVCHIGTYLDNNGDVKFENEKLEELTKIKGVDLIISGHSHKELLGQLNDVFVIQSGSKGKFVGITKIIFKNKKIVNISIENINLLDNRNQLKSNLKIKKIIDKYNQKLKNEGYLDIMFKLNRDFIYSREKLNDLGIFICNNLRKNTNTNIVILNSGSIRKSLFKGNITKKDIYELLPFQNDLVEVKLKGNTLIENILRNQHIMQYAGFYIKNNQVFLDNGEKIDKNKYYNILTNDFILNKGDNFNFKDFKIIKNCGRISDLLIKSLEN